MLYLKQALKISLLGQVSRVEFLTSDSKTKEMTTWSLERSCADTCSNFCVTMGARTKISYCTSCCNQTLCNTDNAAARQAGRAAATLATLLQVWHHWTTNKVHYYYSRVVAECLGGVISVHLISSWDVVTLCR